MFLLSEPWKPEHSRRFVAGEHVRVILTSAAPKGPGVRFPREDESSSVTFATEQTQEHKNAARLASFRSVCCCENQRSEDWSLWRPLPFGQSMISSSNTAAFHCIF